MRHISADYIFPISSEPVKDGVISIDDDGTIIEIKPKSEILKPKSEIEYHKGIICPGFINTHCHLELSYLYKHISENAGMTGFIKELVSKRFTFSEEQIQQSIIDAEAAMIKNGIVAVGDISNNNSTFNQKSKGNLLYHTFIEIFNMDDAKAEDTFNKGKELQLSIINYQLSTSIVPHAPYTMSETLLKLINEYARENKSIITIHNQESEGESELFISKSGIMVEAFKAMGVNTDLMRRTGINSLQSTLPFIKDANKILLVHNTFTSREDIRFALSTVNCQQSTIFFATCPNANIYIENTLPDYNLFIEENVPVTIGTDSLASNWSLSILDELKTITKHYPTIPLQTLLTWSTKNGAEFFNFNQLGTIEKGKKPGLNLLKNTDGMKITAETEVVKLV